MKDKDKIIAELKAENERLRQELATYGATGICEVCSDKANKLANKYFGCLQEIKTIAEEYHHNKPRLLCNMDKFIEQILQKITKAEEE